jgi:hypothetical protein
VKIPLTKYVLVECVRKKERGERRTERERKAEKGGLKTCTDDK